MSNQLSLEEAKEIIFYFILKNNFLSIFFSNKEIKRRIDNNIKGLALSDRNLKKLGMYDLPNLKIELFLGKDLTKDELLSNPNLLSTLFHEAIHGFFKNDRGTGMLLFNSRPNKILNKIMPAKASFVEMGRGLNEGFTNWNVKQSNLDIESYYNLTELISLIAECIGTEKMQCFMSNNYKKIYKTLKMSKDFGTEFIRQTDELYYSEYNILNASIILNYLTDLQETLKDGKVYDRESLRQNYEKIKEATFYSEIFTTERQELFEKLQSDEFSSEVDLNQINQIIEEMRKEINENYREPEKRRVRFLVSSAIEKIVQSLMKDRLDYPITKNDYIRLSYILNYIRDLIGKNEITDKLPFFEAFSEEVEKKMAADLNEIYEAIQKEKSDGFISSSFLAKVVERYDLIYSLYPKDIEEKSKVKDLLALITGNEEQTIEQEVLFKYALKCKCIDELPHLSAIKTNDGKIIILRDSAIVSVIYDSNRNYQNFSRDASYEVEKDDDYLDKMDWTISMDTDLEKMSKQFELLREQYLREDPDTKVYLTEGILQFQNKEGNFFYEIIEGKDGKIVPATFKYDEQVKLNVSDRAPIYNSSLLPVKANSGIYEKIKRKISLMKEFIMLQMNQYRTGEKKGKKEEKVDKGNKGNKKDQEEDISKKEENNPNFQENLRKKYFEKRKLDKGKRTFNLYSKRIENDSIDREENDKDR